jgi:peptide-methionine (S)-S-oxide reductase
MKGVLRTRVGYCGGDYPSPTYYDIGDHSETIQIDFDPKIVSFEELLEIFWTSHTPEHYESNKQYMSAIWYHNEQQKLFALKTAKALGFKVYTVMEPFKFWTNAEYYHQKYLLQNKRGLMELFDNFSEKEFIDSGLAAKLNGFVNGHANLANIEEYLENSNEKSKVIQVLKENSTQSQLYCSRIKKKK